MNKKNIICFHFMHRMVFFYYLSGNINFMNNLSVELQYKLFKERQEKGIPNFIFKPISNIF